MSLCGMTNEERADLHRRISEKIEPMPEMTDSDREVAILCSLNSWSKYSPMAAWKLSTTGYDNGDVPIWEPQDWTGDEEASAMLLEMMPMAVLFRCSPDGPWACRWSSVATAAENYISTRREAIALAFDKMSEGVMR